MTIAERPLGPHLSAAAWPLHLEPELTAVRTGSPGRAAV